MSIKDIAQLPSGMLRWSIVYNGNKIAVVDAMTWYFARLQAYPLLRAKGIEEPSPSKLVITLEE